MVERAYAVRLTDRTVFASPRLAKFLHWVATLVLRLLGWRVVGSLPAAPKYVIIGAPHTSNWDFLYMMLLVFALRGEVRWMGKDSLFRWPLTRLAFWLGGIPIDRSRPRGTVAAAVAAFADSERLALLIPPEGTRHRTGYWRSGFYYIASGAGVPIVMGFADFQRKVGGIGPSFLPTNDIEADMAIIRRFYAGIQPLHPESKGEIALAPRAERRDRMDPEEPGVEG